MQYVRFVAIGILTGTLTYAPAADVITSGYGAQWVYPTAPLDARSAPLGGITGLALDDKKNLIIADPDNRMIMRMSDGQISVIAGTGQELTSGNNIPATRASFTLPQAVAFDPRTQSIYVADIYLRMISQDGIITTISVPNLSPVDVAVDSAGLVYVTDSRGKRVARVSPDGTVTTVVDKLTKPWGLAIDSKNNFYISDDQTVIRVTPDGMRQVIAGTGTAGAGANNVPANTTPLSGPRGLAIDETDAGVTVYIADSGNHNIRRVTPDGIGITLAGTGTAGFLDNVDRTSAQMDAPSDLVLDGAGNVFIADANNGRIRKLNLATNQIETVAGNGTFGQTDGPVASATFFRPEAFTSDSAGNIYISDTRNHVIRRISSEGVVATIAGNGQRRFADGPANEASFDSPRALAVTQDGKTLYVVDAGNVRIRKVEDGMVTTVAGNGRRGDPLNTRDPLAQQFYALTGITVSDGGVYFADEWTDRVWVVRKDGTLAVYAGDRSAAARDANGIPATQALLANPTGLAFDSYGNLYITEAMGYRVRRVDARQEITTVAGSGTRGNGQLCPPKGDQTRTSCPATEAQLMRPSQITVTADGVLYFVDANVIRKVEKGVISTVAGAATGGSGVPGGVPATDVVLRQPSGVLLDSNRDLLILETSSHHIRRVLAKAPVLQLSSASIAMTASSGGAPVKTTVDVAAVSDLSQPIMGMPFTITKDNSGEWLTIERSARTLPATLTITVSPINVAAGTYHRTLTVAADNADPATQTVNIDVTVNPATSGPKMDIPDKTVSFVLTSGDSTAVTKQLTVGNTGFGRLYFHTRAETSNCGKDWLAVTMNRNESLPGIPADLTVRASSVGVSPGTCTGAIVIAENNHGQSITVPVYMNVSGGQQKLALTQSGLTFFAARRAGSTPPLTFSVLNAGLGAMDWAITDDNVTVKDADATAWLRVKAASGVLTGKQAASVQVSVSNYDSLTPGEHFGQIKVTSKADPNRSQVLSVVLNVLKEGTPIPPSIAPAEVLVETERGGNSGEHRVQICNPAKTDLPFEATGDRANSSIGLLVLPSKGLVPAMSCRDVSIEADTERASAGSYDGAVQLRLGKDIRTVPIQIVVQEAEARSKTMLRQAVGCEVTPAILSPVGNADVIIGQPVTIQASVSTGSCSRSIDVVVGVTVAGSVVTMSPTGVPREFRGTWVPQPNLPAKVTIDAKGVSGEPGASFKTRSVSVNVKPQLKSPIIPAPGGVRDSASLLVDGPAAPGGFVTIFGYELGDADASGRVNTKVLLGGKPLRITSALVRYNAEQPYQQINALLPFDVSTRTDLQLLVDAPGRLSVPAPMLVAVARPAIFATNEQGFGQGQILYKGGVANAGNAAPRGEEIVILCSGLGSPSVSPQNVTLTIGGSAAQVTAVVLNTQSGLYQVTARVPRDAATGNEVPVIMRVAGQDSQPGIVMAVR